MKKALAILLAVVIAVSCLPVTASNRIDLPTREGVGMSIDGFDTTDLSGNLNVTSDILQNADLTFINYWATWCGPCVGEMPHIQEAHEYYSATPEADVQIIGVISESNGCTPQSALQFLNDNGYTWLNIRKDSVLNSVFSTSGYIPQTLIVDRNGVVRDHVIGSFSSSSHLESFIEMWLDVFQNHEGEDCTISFVNGVTGEVFAEATTPYGYPIMPESEFPAAQEMEGYSFASWTIEGCYEAGYEDIVNIAMGDITVTANYSVAMHRVRYYDGVTGNLFYVQQVAHGQAVTNPPTHPEHEGWIFQGWDTDLSCVTEDLYVHGICVQESEELLGDVNGDGYVNIADALIVMRVAINVMTIENPDLADYDQNGFVNIADALQIMRAAIGNV